MSKSTEKLIKRKLVRDLIPDIIEQETGNKRPSETAIGFPDRMYWLKKKLQEEFLEVQNAETAEEICEELADVIEVCLAFGPLLGVDKGHIENMRLSKRAEKGGFDKFVLMKIE